MAGPSRCRAGRRAIRRSSSAPSRRSSASSTSPCRPPSSPPKAKERHRMPEHPAPRLAVALLLACPLACRIEPLHELDTGDDPGIATNLLPTIPAIDRASEPTVGWEAMVRQHLAFLAGPLAAGRRPGTDGA